MSALATCIQHRTEYSSCAIGKEKEIRSIQIGKQKATLYAEDIFYILKNLSKYLLIISDKTYLH